MMTNQEHLTLIDAEITRLETLREKIKNPPVELQMDFQHEFKSKSLAERLATGVEMLSAIYITLDDNPDLVQMNEDLINESIANLTDPDQYREIMLFYPPEEAGDLEPCFLAKPISAQRAQEVTRINNHHLYPIFMPIFKTELALKVEAALNEHFTN